MKDSILAFHIVFMLSDIGTFDPYKIMAISLSENLSSPGLSAI